MRGRLLIILLTLAPFLTDAQIPFEGAGSSLEAYDQQAIYLNSTFWGTRYIKGNRSHSVGMGFQNLKRELEASPLAMVEFKRFRWARRTSTVLNIVGLASFLVAPSLVSRNPNTALTVISGGTALIFATIPINIKGNNHLAKSVWLHNRRVIAP